MASDTIHKDKSALHNNQRKTNNNIRKFFNRFPHNKSPPLSPSSDMSQCPVLSSSSSLSSENDLSPTQIQIDLVRTSWERVSQIRHANDDRNISSAHAFGLAFYDALFDMDREVKRLFDNVFQQARALTGMISYIARAPGVTTASRPPCCTPTMPTTIRDINASKKDTNNTQEYEEGDPEWLAAQMRELGARHYFYNVNPHHLELVGPAFVTALKKRLGDEYTDDIGDAWVKANSYVAYNMRLGFESQQAWEEGSITTSSSKKSKASCSIQ
ncbi:hypothetical protein INT47_008737 [Mucor saturninus]|uniref:Globin domain-containing protein n=1 Tax=Mucor saturninus TaxID=64648 RepID=A0A8H7V8Z5_9FUNG|nr:hypothetical protein INT47_008737 [Mucor saturninus]